ncbi:MAG: amidase family protein [Candidatus Heteroscillospira sp.]|jgi:amidase
MFKPFEKGIKELQQALSSGEITSHKLVEYYLGRISAYNGSVNAVLCVNPQALAEADRLDAERRDGKVRGTLHGIPILVKDNINTAELPTTASCVELRENRPSEDAFLLRQLKKAGAIVLAKTNLTEFARNGLTAGSLGGQTHNPYDLTRTPGGSSGGTGAAMAMNFGAAGLGTDTANSIRSPSSANSLVGLRPTVGLISRSGLVPCTYKQDTAGPIAKYVYDCAAMLDACRGYDCRDSLTVTQLGRTPACYLDSLKPDGLKGKRIGILMDNLGSDSEVRKVMDRCFELIRTAGAELIEVSAPELETDRVFAECDVQRYETAASMNDYFSSIPNCPVSSLKELVSRGTLHPCVADDLEACAEYDEPYCPEYEAQLLRAVRNTHITERLFAEHRLDALCYPHQQILAVPIGAPSQAKRNGIIASTMGFPAITVPGGFSTPDENAPLGVPVGIEFMGLPYTEPTLIEIAYAFEQLSKFRRPPMLGLENRQ